MSNVHEVYSHLQQGASDCNSDHILLCSRLVPIHCQGVTTVAAKLHYGEHCPLASVVSLSKLTGLGKIGISWSRSVIVAQPSLIWHAMASRLLSLYKNTNWLSLSLLMHLSVQRERKCSVYSQPDCSTICRPMRTTTGYQELLDPPPWGREPEVSLKGKEG